MKISVIIHGSPYSSQSAISALAFSKAAIISGHEIYQAFFYHDGVFNSTALSIPAQDEQFPGKLWADFATEENIKLVSCISSASRRGIHDQAEALRHELQSANLNTIYQIAGLGELVEASLTCDRTITFGA
ncbi:MAG: tRNA 2-thiouridine synthesizing protein D [Pseudomonadales bacterium]|jgi:tRNA 2-thiouridine synthesizing protein D